MTLGRTPASSNLRGAAAGIIAGGLALGVAQLIAGLVSSGSSPVVATGQAAIDLTPAPVKNFAISSFGSNDKIVLIAGILVVLAVFAAAIGIAAVRRPAWGWAGLGLFVVIGLVATLTRPHASAEDAMPTLLGGVAAALALRRLARLAAPPPAPPATTRQARPEYTAPAPGDAADPPLREEWRPYLPAAGEPAAPGGPAAPPTPPARLPGPQRRSFLTSGAVLAGTAVVAGLGGRLLGEHGNVAAARSTLRIPPPTRPAPPLPSGADLNIPGLSSFITPSASFYRVDTALVLPEITPSAWQLRIHGMVARPVTLTYHDLLQQPLLEDYITLCCVSNPVAGPYIGNARWLGVSVRRLLRQAGIRAGADQLLCTSADGFTCGTPVQTAMDGRDAMLAVAMNGQALPVAHGFPVRMVVPGLYGYVSACKWITDIEVTTFASARAYWTDRGWSQQAPIKTESRIDVPGSGSLKAGRHAVAGVAWAQHKGIDAVEVRVDRGPWHQARLGAVPGIDTWRQWAWQWDAAPGTHLIESRATDRTGYTQTALQAPPEPNGASGYPQVSVKVS
ncbi:MAG TPA: molybdopterin-dependent oxidoreductase [Streptosporangiaceae bacterium]|nr:molybdopterin-dependent oxidoreductase [Streptosporangiaceae bacterium]